MVDMCVTQNDRTDFSGIKWKASVALQGFFPSALIETALKQDLLIIHLKQIHGSRRGTGCPDKLNAHDPSLPWNPSGLQGKVVTAIQGKKGTPDDSHPIGLQGVAQTRPAATGIPTEDDKA